MSNTLLNIITPFKNNSLVELIKSVENLLAQKFILIKHIIVCDSSSYLLTKNYFESNIKATINYKYLLIVSKKKGIYSSINQGLDYLDESEPYLILGAGDILNVYSNINLDRRINIFNIPYSLSSKKGTLINKFRPIFMGMPYCHNALIFRKNYLKYNQQYSLSADYQYYLNFISLIKNSIIILNQDKFIPEVEGCVIIFDDQDGLSSNRKTIVHLQNLLIIFRKYFLLGPIIYIILNLSKLILKLKK